jgi:hypothetical protein
VPQYAGCLPCTASVVIVVAVAAVAFGMQVSLVIGYPDWIVFVSWFVGNGKLQNAVNNFNLYVRLSAYRNLRTAERLLLEFDIY